MSTLKDVFLVIITLREHVNDVMSSGKMFHSVAAAVSINRLLSFTVLLLLGTNNVVFADLRCLVGWYQFNNNNNNNSL